MLTAMPTTPEHFNMHDAKTQFSRIIKRVEQGESVVIDRDGRPTAMVIPFPTWTGRSGWGSMKGQITLAGDWDSPETNEAIAEDFGI